MKVKTSDLTGKALDYVVALCDGREITFALGGSLQVRGRLESGDDIPPGVFMEEDLWYFWNPSSEWAQGGPIIEREGITIAKCFGDLGEPQKYWVATSELNAWEYGYSPYHEQDEDRSLRIMKPDAMLGNTPLIAAMRCYIASKIGDLADVPEDLL